MSVFLLVLLTLFSLTYVREALAVTGAVAVALMLLGCVYVVQLLNGT